MESRFALWLWWLHGFTGPYKVKTPRAEYLIIGEPHVPAKSSGLAIQEHEKYEFSMIGAMTGRLTIREFVILDEALFYKFLDSTFQDIRKHSIRNLIIDIRGNPGGGDSYGIELATYLHHKPFRAYAAFYHKKSKALEDFTMRFIYPEDRSEVSRVDAIRLDCFGQGHEKHAYGTKYKSFVKTYLPKPNAVRFKGNVYLLIDSRVYSAANVLAGIVKDYQVGTIIGTETGQSPSNDGQGCWFTLPNSNIIAVGATTLSIRPSGDVNTTRGVLPDFEVTPSKRDIVERHDPVLGFALELIKKRNTRVSAK